MKVISGKYKGRKILGFNIDGTRPTMDRIKESLFAMIHQKTGKEIHSISKARSSVNGI
ncbi:MAG: RsmD family RNA methyltransferase, partial [Bacilli bacterium]|nr:RsmD family RNA methyltransferase [Bacilli bacterium]